MKNAKYERKYVVINIVIAALLLISEIIGIVISADYIVQRLIFRVCARGLLGIFSLYNSWYVIYTNNAVFMVNNNSLRSRRIVGIALGIAGILLVGTALQGYGTNGDPRLYWWK